MFNTQAEIRIKNLNAEKTYTHELIYAYYSFSILF
jgi:hypothetical protein